VADSRFHAGLSHIMLVIPLHYYAGMPSSIPSRLRSLPQVCKLITLSVIRSSILALPREVS
jgi:hypothetical protein